MNAAILLCAAALCASGPRLANWIWESIKVSEAASLTPSIDKSLEMGLNLRKPTTIVYNLKKHMIEFVF